MENREASKMDGDVASLASLNGSEALAQAVLQLNAVQGGRILEPGAFVWYVVRTNPQCEDRAQAALEAAGFISFLPKMRKETRHPRTKVWRVRAYPLMTRYLFLGMEADRAHWGHVRGCDGVECVLGVNGLPVRVPSRDVEALIDAQAKGRFDQMRRSSVKRPYRMEEPVMITEGPFHGFHGNVNDYHGKRMIEVMIAIFGRLTPVTVDMGAVRAA